MSGSLAFRVTGIVATAFTILEKYYWSTISIPGMTSVMTSRNTIDSKKFLCVFGVSLVFGS